MREHDANPGRGAYRMAVAAQRIVAGTRLVGARPFNAPHPDRIAFTLSTTDGPRMALKSLIRPGDCSPAVQALLGTLPAATVKASFARFNPRAHAEALVAAVRDVARNARARP